MRLSLSILFFTSTISLLAQAELDKVRNMFSPPTEDIEVYIWKGHINHSHPVELFFAEKDNDVYGYYRLISSGNSFLLEGERTANGYQLSEYSLDNVPLGYVTIDDLPPYKKGQSSVLKWHNSDHSDLLEMSLKYSDFSDYPDRVFKPTIKKFGKFSKSTYQSYLIERIAIDNLIVKYADDKQAWEENAECSENEKLDFNISISDEVAEFNELNNKLRKRYNNAFEYYELENEAEFKKIAYASQFFLCDVDYLQIGNEVFDKWMEEFVEEKQKSIRKTIAAKVKEMNEEENSTHYHYKWDGWTEIDLINNHIVSGRMVFINSWENKAETIAFTFDLQEEEHIDILNQFKSDFNFSDYLENFLSMEINSRKSQGIELPNDINPIDFRNMSLSDNNLVISKDFDRMYGNQEFYIPYSELKSLVKRNSIIKSLIR